MIRPTGELVRTADGVDLVLTRRYAAPIVDVWASVTEPERTARWFGPWRGEPGEGRTIEVQMAFEDGTPWTEVRIDACDPPEHLAVSVTEESGAWNLEVRLAEADGTTTLTLVDHRPSLDGIGDFGSGWEWYLDGLTAAREGGPRPEFGGYLAALREPYEEQARRLSV